MHSDRRLTIRALVVQLNLDKETLREIWSFGKNGPNATGHKGLPLKNFLA
jgi:hypothetical protein